MYLATVGQLIDFTVQILSLLKLCSLANIIILSDEKEKLRCSKFQECQRKLSIEFQVGY